MRGEVYSFLKLRRKVREKKMDMEKGKEEERRGKQVKRSRETWVSVPRARASRQHCRIQPAWQLQSEHPKNWRRNVHQLLHAATHGQGLPRRGGDSYSLGRMVICSAENGSPVLIQDNDVHTATSLSSQIPLKQGGKREEKSKGTKGNYNCTE